MYARVAYAMAQFVLKIEKLSHIIEPTPILEMARAYGLHPRLWLLQELYFLFLHDYTPSSNLLTLHSAVIQCPVERGILWRILFKQKFRDFRKRGQMVGEFPGNGSRKFQKVNYSTEISGNSRMKISRKSC